MDMTVRETAELLKVSEKTIYRWVTAGKIPYHRVGNQYRFRHSELLDWSAGNGQRPSEQLLSDASEQAEMPSLCESVQRGGIYFNLSGDDPSEVIEELVSILNLPDVLDRSIFVSALREREEAGSTGIGSGVAVPHTRRPFPELTSPMISIGFLRYPIDWQAIDRRPVHVVFIPVSQNLKTHLYLMGRIYHLMQSNDWGKLGETPIRRELMAVIEEVDASVND